MSKNKENHIVDLKETFANLKAVGLKLNPENCIFRVSKGKMLGYIISAEGIIANPDKTKAIMTMIEPSTKKEVQRLKGRKAALSKFISKSAECSLPFFKALRGRDNVEWGPEQSKAFRQLKNYMATWLMVTVPDPGGPLLLYVAAYDHAVSRVLAHEKEEGQRQFKGQSIFVLEALSGAKLNYTNIEKIAYAVLISSRKLKHYF
jgi:hypothetical protein